MELEFGAVKRVELKKSIAGLLWLTRRKGWEIDEDRRKRSPEEGGDVDTFRWPVGKRPRSNSNEQGGDAVEVSGSPSLSLASLELMLSSATCEDCANFSVGFEVGSCGSVFSVVSVVSSPVLASCDTEMCLDEFWERIC